MRGIACGLEPSGMLELVNMGFGGVSCGSTTTYCKTTTTSYCDLSNWMVKRVVMPFEVYCSVLFGQIRVRYGMFGRVCSSTL